jgi:hypothetical protein
MTSSTASQDLRRLAAERKSGWLSNVCAALALVCSVFGVLVMWHGYREALRLVDIAASGEKFTPGASAMFGGMIIGATFEFVSLLLLAVALLHSRRRRKTLLAGIPIVVFAVLTRWPELLGQ